ncbi:hypothetical protein J2S43_004869 [Catenuloplanes nepalensis]|uniref:Uncharacterized protein n=1 Tax=Catenuloplanes nepalensis TaxID=587533 RepID=A0ABT9MY32_9ACTN|nr:hypothetical protein [Catenuloplanes nepalensis]MDP9796357.1 hypothetical protein [Catenuloplanes nepalensis]
MSGVKELGAFRHDDAGEVARLVVAYAAERGVEAQVGAPGGGEAANQVDVFEPLDGWTVVMWPGTGAEATVEIARVVSLRLGTVASCVSAFEDDFWSHLVFESGRERDRFTSRPDYFEEESGTEHRWISDPATVAGVFGVETGEITDYLTAVTEEDLDADDERRAHPDDEYALTDSWVFVDFWRHLGITYPDADVPPLQYGITLAPGWEKTIGAVA